MKNKIIALIAILSLGASASAFGAAAEGAWQTQSDAGIIEFPGDTTHGPLIQFKPSANVHMAYDCADGQNYTVGAYHESGTKIYGTSSGDAKIYMYDTGSTIGAEPTDLQTIPNSASSVEWGSGWSALK